MVGYTKRVPTRELLHTQITHPHIGGGYGNILSYKLGCILCVSDIELYTDLISVANKKFAKPRCIYLSNRRVRSKPIEIRCSWYFAKPRRTRFSPFFEVKPGSKVAQFRGVGNTGLDDWINLSDPFMPKHRFYAGLILWRLTLRIHTNWPV